MLLASVKLNFYIYKNFPKFISGQMISGVVLEALTN
jgi:hypothetical protein